MPGLHQKGKEEGEAFVVFTTDCDERIGSAEAKKANCSLRIYVAELNAKTYQSGQPTLKDALRRDVASTTLRPAMTLCFRNTEKKRVC